jgi:inorganic phosphate transporter, PiT family
LLTILLSAVTGCIVWNIITYLLRLPSSSSHALIGGLIGAGVVAAGFKAIIWQSFLGYVIIPLFVAPLIGFLFSAFLMKLLLALFRNFPPKIAVLFKRIQIGSLVFLAMSHGSNDAQKAMGIIAIALAAGSAPAAFQLPYWAVMACAVAITIGLSFGGWKIIKTIHRQVPQMTPVHSFASQAASGVVIYLASIIGFPISATQTVGSTIMGAGAGYRVSTVRWGITKNIVLAWLITIPAAALIAAATCVIILKRRTLWGF